MAIPLLGRSILLLAMATIHLWTQGIVQASLPASQQRSPGPSTCTGIVAYISDGDCDRSNNNVGCEYDGGDCCSCTCVDSNHYTCGVRGYDCQDPTVSDECVEESSSYTAPSDEEDISFGIIMTIGVLGIANVICTASLCVFVICRRTDTVEDEALTEIASDDTCSDCGERLSVP